MKNNLAVISAVLSSNMSVALWIVAAVLLVAYVLRRRSRKGKEEGSF